MCEDIGSADVGSVSADTSADLPPAESVDVPDDIPENMPAEDNIDTSDVTADINEDTGDLTNENSEDNQDLITDVPEDVVNDEPIEVSEPTDIDDVKPEAVASDYGDINNEMEEDVLSADTGEEQPTDVQPEVADETVADETQETPADAEPEEQLYDTQEDTAEEDTAYDTAETPADTSEEQPTDTQPEVADETVADESQEMPADAEPEEQLYDTQEDAAEEDTAYDTAETPADTGEEQPTDTQPEVADETVTDESQETPADAESEEQFYDTQEDAAEEDTAYDTAETPADTSEEQPTDTQPEVADETVADESQETPADTSEEQIAAESDSSGREIGDYETWPETLGNNNFETIGEFAPASNPYASDEWDTLKDVPFAGEQNAVVEYGDTDVVDASEMIYNDSANSGDIHSSDNADTDKSHRYPSPAAGSPPYWPPPGGPGGPGSPPNLPPMDGGDFTTPDDLPDDVGFQKVLKRNQLDLLRDGNDAINSRIEAQEDDYRDKGLSDDEIRDRLAADRWNFQKEFLEDAFPGQDVSPNVFNGFSENGSKDRLRDIEQSNSLKDILEGIEVNNDVAKPSQTGLTDLSDAAESLKKYELPDNAKIVNPSDVDMSDALGMDAPGFWQHHGNTKEDYINLAKGIPEVQKRLDNGEPLEALIKDPEIGATANQYFNPEHMIELTETPDGKPAYNGDGRHRIAAAGELGYSFPAQFNEAKADLSASQGTSDFNSDLRTDKESMTNEVPQAESQEDGTDWERTSLTPEQEKQILEMQENDEIGVPSVNPDLKEPEWQKNHLPAKSGEFLGERGDSAFRPNDEKVLQLMKQYGRDTVDYKNNQVDFSPFTKHDSPWGELDCEVEIGHMTDHRTNPTWEFGRRPSGTGHDPKYDIGNFAQAENALLERIQKTYPDATIKDVQAFINKNELTWHECPDGKTMQLVPTAIHDACRHSGGVSEMKTRMAYGDIELSD